MSKKDIVEANNANAQRAVRFSKGILVSPKLLAMVAAAPVTSKRPRIKPPFKQRLIAALERHLATVHIQQ